MIWKFILHDGISSYILSEEPKGWSDIVLHVKRDEATHGVFFEFSETTLTFYGYPASVIEAGYDLFGIDCNMKLEVLMSCDGGVNYEDFYVGRLMFTRYKKMCGDLCSVTIPVEQADEVMTFRNRLATKVDLDATQSIDGVALSPYAHLGTLQTLPSKGIYKGTEWNKCEADDAPVDATYIVATNPTLDCGVLKRVVPIGNPATTVDVSYSKYWTMPLDCMLRNEIDTFSGIGDVVANVADITPVLVVSEDGLYNIDFNIECQVHGFAETSAKDIDWNTNPAPLVYNYGYKQLNYNVYLKINNNAPVLISNGSSTTNCHYSTALPCSNVQALVTSGVYAAASANDVFHTYGTYSPTRLDVAAAYATQLNLLAGDNVYVYVEVTQDGEYYHHPLFAKDVTFGQCVFFNDENKFKANLISYYPDTNTRAYYINETYARITESITNNKMTVLSDYYGRTDSEPYQSTTGYDGCNALLFLTNGLMVRNQLIQGQPPKISLSFNEVFDAMNSIDNIGIGLEEDTNKNDGSMLIRIEPMQYFYDSSTIILSCPDVQEVERSLIENKYFSIVKFGYDKYEAEEYTGIDEFLSQREYTTKLQAVKNVDNRICKFIASGYAIEVTRRKGNVDTKDWRFDNDTFIVCAYRPGDGQMYVEQGVTDATNIVDPPTVYNFRISPIRNAIRWCKTWLAGVKDWQNAILKFTSGTGNYFAAGEYVPEGSYVSTCISDDGGYTENNDISTALVVPDSVMKPIWVNEEIKFTYPLSFADYLNIKANPKGVVAFTCGKATEYGYIMNIEYKPNDGLADFTLLKAIR